MECVCGFVVVVGLDGERRLWPDGPPHAAHLPLSPTSPEWAAQEAAVGLWYIAEAERGGRLATTPAGIEASAPALLSDEDDPSFLVIGDAPAPAAQPERPGALEPRKGGIL